MFVDQPATGSAPVGPEPEPIERPAVDSIASTVAIVLIGLFAPVLIATRIPRWLSEGLPAGLVPTDALVLPALVLFAYLARGLWESHNERPIDLRSTNLVRKECSRVIERSYFGVGRARGWTVNPRTSLSAVEFDVSFDRRPVAPPAPEPEDERARAEVPVVVVAPTPVAPEELFAETEEYAVKRGDSWWTLADDRLNDGRRWAEIRDLNLHRVMTDGTVLTADSHLLEGFTVLVPVKVVDENT